MYTGAVEIGWHFNPENRESYFRLKILTRVYRIDAISSVSADVDLLTASANVRASTTVYPTKILIKKKRFSIFLTIFFFFEFSFKKNI